MAGSPSQTSLGARVFRNTVFLTGGQIVVTGLNILLIPILANTLGVEEFGRYGLALSVAALVLVSVEFGSRHLIIRQVSRVDASASPYCVNGLLVQAVLAVVALSGATLFSLYAYRSGVGMGPMTTLVLLASAAYACWAATDFLLAFFHSREQMHVAALVQSLQTMVYAAVAIGLVVWAGAGARGVLAWQLVCFAGGGLVAFRLVAQAFKVTWRDASADFARTYLGQLWVFAVLYIASQGIVQFPPIMLSFQVSEAELGVYQAAARAILAIELIPRLVNSGIYPILMKRDAVEPERWARLAEASLRYSMLLGLWMAGGLALLANEAAAFVFRAEGYGPVGTNVRLMCVLLFLRFVTYPLGTLLVAANRERWCAAVTPLAALVAAGVAWWGAAGYGAVGGTIGWIAGAALVAAGFVLGAWRSLPSVLRSRTLARTVVATIIVAAATCALLKLPFGWRLAAGLILPPSVILLVGAATGRDLSTFLALLPRQARRPPGTQGATPDPGSRLPG